MAEYKSEINKVMVYIDRARVCRSGHLKVEEGRRRLEIAALPMTLEEDSIRCRAHGTARAKLLGVDVEMDFSIDSPIDRLRELEAQREKLSDELERLKARNEILAGERTAITDLVGQSRVFAQGLAKGELEAEGVAKLLDTLHDRSLALSVKLIDIGAERRELERQKDRVERELDQLTQARGQERKRIIVDFDVEQAGELTVDVCFVIDGAGWRPVYDLRLDEKGPTPFLEVDYLAQVAQQTGEDWTDVTLTLSTVRPSLAEMVPELTTWYLEPWDMRRLSKAAPRKIEYPEIEDEEGVQYSMPAESNLEALSEEDVLIATANVENGGVAAHYLIPGHVDIPTDGTPHTVAIAHFDMEPEIDYIAAPKQIEAVYRRAHLHNLSSFTLLPGKANLFVGDEFIGATALDLVVPEGEFDLYLGVEERLRIERMLIKREVDKRAVGNKRRLRFGYEIKVENLLDANAKICIQDQIPVSKHEDVKVRPERYDPEPDQETQLKTLIWNLNLSPGEKRSIHFGFVVEYPSEMRILGLP
jgi:uncharacterized protein (TIGR02231 family)